MKSIFISAALVFLLIVQVQAQQRPSGLLTDLLHCTDKVYIGGYASTVSLEDADKVLEDVQFAEIRSSRPTFSWIVPGEADGTMQIGYRIIVANTRKDASEGNGNVWDSKHVQSSASIGVLFGAGDLQPAKTYYWRVKVFTTTGGESDWSEVKAFRTAASLSAYQSSFEPLVKTAQRPVGVSTVGEARLFDFGKDAFGQLLISLGAANDHDTVQISLGEGLKNGLVDQSPGGTIRYQQYNLPLMKGWHTYRIKIRSDKRNTGPAAVLMPSYIGEVLPFRYVQVDGHSLSSPVELTREMVHYPFGLDPATFSSSNDTLNKIWELCKYSIKATSFAGVYVDGDRERIPYEADALINQLGHYGVDREYAMARRSSEYLLQHPTWPTEWILQALIISWNDYLYTGDARSLVANYEVLKARTLSALKEKTGLISTRTGLQTPEFSASINFKDQIKDIVDWPVSGTDGFVFDNYNSVINAFHYKALVLMEKIATATGNRADAGKYAAEHKKFKEVFNKRFLNTALGIYKDGDSTGHSSLHANMFALNLGLVPERYVPSVMKFIRSRGMASSVYGSQFLMDALYDGGEADHALALLTATGDRSWYNMIRVGSTITLEAWDNKFKPNQDWNHAWGAAPANIIPRRLMGVEPMTPGFETVRVMPQMGNLAHADLTMPTIRGNIEIGLRNEEEFKMYLTLPANMSAEIYLPVIVGKNILRHDEKVIKVRRLKGKPFWYVGKVLSGSHVFTVSSN